jgi:hypothetical protein
MFRVTSLMAASLASTQPWLAVAACERLYQCVRVITDIHVKSTAWLSFGERILLNVCSMVANVIVWHVRLHVRVEVVETSFGECSLSWLASQRPRVHQCV